MAPSDPLVTLLSEPEVHSPVFYSRRRLLWIGNQGGRPQAWLGAMDGSAARVLAPELDRVLSLQVVPTGKGVVLTHDHHGDELEQLLWIDPDTGMQRSLTHDFPKAKHIVQTCSADGKLLFFASNRRDPRFFDYYQMNLDSGAVVCLWKNDTYGLLSTRAMSPDKQSVVVCRESHSLEHRLYCLHLPSGSVQEWSDPKSPSLFLAVHWDAQRNRIWALTDRNTDVTALQYLDLTSDRWEIARSEEGPIEWMQWNPEGSGYVLGIHRQGCSHLLWRPNEQPGAEHTFVPEEPAVITGVRFASDGKTVVFAMSTYRSGSNLYLWETPQRPPRPLWQDSVADPSPRAIPCQINFQSFDQRLIPAWYYRPQAQSHAKSPVLIFVHGGPYAQYRPQLDPFAQYLVQQGVAVLAPNIRGSSGYGRSYAELDDRGKRLDSIRDIASLVDWIHLQPELDGDRVAIYGRSYGGFVVLAAITLYPKLWKAAIDVVGIANMVTYMRSTSPYRRYDREAEYGSLQDGGLLKKISPIHRADIIQTPLLLIHGRNDPRVPVGETEQMAAVLQQRNHPVEVNIYEDEGHIISKLTNKIACFKAMAHFLRRELEIH